MRLNVRYKYKGGKYIANITTKDTYKHNVNKQWFGINHVTIMIEYIRKIDLEVAMFIDTGL